MLVGDYLVHRIGEMGIKHVFEVYGAANGPFIDAFTRTNKTRYVGVKHEQAAGFAAEVYAKVTGKLAVATATSGPGGQNFVTPLGNCYYDSVPVMFIVGQTQSKYMSPDPSVRQVGFQETPIVDIVRPITKYAKLITDPRDIRYEFERAAYIAQEGRPGPVLLDLPVDIQKATVNLDELVGFDPEAIRGLPR